MYNEVAMARMFPSEFVVTVPGDAGQVGERMVYDALRKLPDDWTVIHNCWRHLMVKGKSSANPRHVTYEADFVVLIPGCGILVLEVKNWQRAKVENGRWYRGVAGGGYEPVKHDSPLNQAFLAMKNLRAELDKSFSWGRAGRSRLECRCMAVLLGELGDNVELSETPFDAPAVDAQLNGCGGAAVPRNEIYDSLYLCGIKALGSGLRERIERLFCYNNPTTAAELDEVRRYLLQNLVLRTDAATATTIINSAAAPIVQVLPLLEESPIGVHVSGCAGSGKSTMLCCEAARLALKARQEGTSVRTLVLCFNYNLAEYLRVQGTLRLAGVRRFDSSSPLVLDAFQSMVTTLCAMEGLSLPESLFEEGALQPLIEKLATKQQHLFDNIFVDEAQDFLPEWWSLLRVLLRKGGKLYMFSDAGQLLYNHAGNMPELPVRLRLQRNLRNSAQIARFCLPEDGNLQSVLPLDGPEVEVRAAVDSPENRAAVVKECISQLLSEHYALNDIVVLTPWRRNTSLKDSLLDEIIDFPADDETRENADKRLRRCLAPGASRVLGETIKAFKGLESPAVILTDISAPKSGPGSGFTPNELYVACTRARYRLIIIPTSSGAEYLAALK